jgi:hemolysin D
MVKVEAFPFTRYGAVKGTLQRISRDAIADPKLGSTYIATIKLDQQMIVVDGASINLNSGLAVTADIRTGSRRIISYLLSPVQTTVAQAGRER